MSAGYSAGYLGAASGWTPACPLGPRYPVGRAVSHHVSQYVVHCGVPTVCRQLRVTLLPFPRQGQRAGCIRCLRERHRGQQPDAGEAVSTERAWDCRAWRTPLSRLGGGTGGQGQGEHLISGQHLIFSSFNFKQIHPDFLLICEAALAEPSAGHSPAAAKTGQALDQARCVWRRGWGPPTQLKGLQETPAHPASSGRQGT